MRIGEGLDPARSKGLSVRLARKGGGGEIGVVVGEEPRSDEREEARPSRTGVEEQLGRAGSSRDEASSSRSSLAD